MMINRTSIFVLELVRFHSAGLKNRKLPFPGYIYIIIFSPAGIAGFIDRVWPNSPSLRHKLKRKNNPSDFIHSRTYKFSFVDISVRSCRRPLQTFLSRLINQ